MVQKDLEFNNTVQRVLKSIKMVGLCLEYFDQLLNQIDVALMGEWYVVSWTIHFILVNSQIQPEFTSRYKNIMRNENVNDKRLIRKSDFWNLEKVLE